MMVEDFSNQLLDGALLMVKLLIFFKDTLIMDKSINMWPMFMQPQFSNVQIVDMFIIEGRWNTGELSKFFRAKLVNLNYKI